MKGESARHSPTSNCVGKVGGIKESVLEQHHRPFKFLVRNRSRLVDGTTSVSAWLQNSQVEDRVQRKANTSWLSWNSWVDYKVLVPLSGVSYFSEISST